MNNIFSHQIPSWAATADFATSPEANSPIYQCVLPCSLHRLPMELIQDIMLEHDFTNCGALLLFGHVCRRWRHIILATPALWRNIDFVEPFSGQTLSKLTVKHLTALTDIAFALQQSRRHALDVRLEFTSILDTQILDIILKERERWRSFSLRILHRNESAQNLFCSRLFEQGHSVQLRQLQVLTLELPQRFWPYLSTSIFNDAPELRAARLVRDLGPSNTLPYQLDVPWRALRSLDLECQCSPIEACDILLPRSNSFASLRISCTCEHSPGHGVWDASLPNLKDLLISLPSQPEEQQITHFPRFFTLATRLSRLNYTLPRYASMAILTALREVFIDSLPVLEALEISNEDFDHMPVQWNVTSRTYSDENNPLICLIPFLRDGQLAVPLPRLQTFKYVVYPVWFYQQPQMEYGNDLGIFFESLEEQACQMTCLRWDVPSERASSLEKFHLHVDLSHCTVKWDQGRFSTMDKVAKSQNLTFQLSILNNPDISE